jgi:phosphate-selective porin OprO/OprP
MTFRTRAAAAAAALLLPLAAWAQSPPAPSTAELLQRLEAQEKRIEALEAALRQQGGGSSAAGAVAAAPPPAPPAPAPVPGTAPGSAVRPAVASAGSAPTPGVVQAGPQGFIVQSTDGANVLRLRANLAVDGRWFSDSGTKESADTWLLRRARPYIEGTVNNIYDFRLMPDFAGGKAVILDAFVAGRFQPWLVVQAGKFKAPVGLERLQPDQFNRFLELALPSALVPNRDLGLQVGGDFLHGTVSYAIGAFDGTTDGASTDANATPDADSNDGRKEWEGRLFTQPFVHSANPYLRGFGVGVGGSYANEVGSPTNTLLPSYRTPGQQSLFGYRTGDTATYADGRHYRLAPQLYYYSGSFGLLSEYVRSSQDVSRTLSSALTRSATLDNSAWQVSLAYFLTGERESYNSFVPNSTFQPGHPGWGAWEIALRYHELHIDPEAFAGGADSFADPALAANTVRAYGIGLNWYLNQNIKWMLDYERATFDGGGKNGSDRGEEAAILTRFSLIF